MRPLSIVIDAKMNLLDPQGLAANQRGEITEVQNQRLNMALGTDLGSIYNTFIVLMPILCILTFLSITLYLLVFEDNYLLVLASWGITLAMVAVNFVPLLWKLFKTATQLKRDRDHRAIRQTQGQLVFDKNGYYFQAGERRLGLPSNDNTGGLLPGIIYRAFYLEESGFLLSAEQVFPANPAQVHALLQSILAQANGFTLEELERNRSGEVTPSQRLKPLSGVLMGMLLGLLVLVFDGLLFFLVAPNLDSGDDLPVLIVSALFLGIFALMGGWLFLNSLLDMSISSIEQAQGAGRKEKYTGRSKRHSTRYYYIIDDKRFQVSRRAYSALLDGIDYRIYYLPRTKKLLSIEPVDVNTQAPQYNFGN